MQVAALRRYPVKSLLGEDLDTLDLGAAGIAGDRALALLDVETGRVATAKHPRLWRQLLQWRASGDPGSVVLTLPDGRRLAADGAQADGAELDAVLSALLGRRVHLSAERPAGATVERPAPEDVLEHGVTAKVAVATLEIGQGSPGSTFVDWAPVHLVTTATLERVGTQAERYRPNLVVAGGEPFGETAWVGREVVVGEVVLRATLPTPRCAVPTLEHGLLPPAPDALRVLLAEHRLEVPGFGVLPCAGVYAEVVRGGRVRAGDAVTLR